MFRRLLIAAVPYAVMGLRIVFGGTKSDMESKTHQFMRDVAWWLIERYGAAVL